MSTEKVRYRLTPVAPVGGIDLNWFKFWPRRPHGKIRKIIFRLFRVIHITSV